MIAVSREDGLVFPRLCRLRDTGQKKKVSVQAFNARVRADQSKPYCDNSKALLATYVLQEEGQNCFCRASKTASAPRRWANITKVAEKLQQRDSTLLTSAP